MFEMTAGEEYPATPIVGARSSPTGKRIANGTDQQEVLWAALIGDATHILAEARAGTGKSSACREAMHRIHAVRPGERIRYAVYNKTNATEFNRDCPPGVDAGTSHSFGYQALRATYRSTMEKNKTYIILDETREGRNLPRYMRKSVAMLAGKAKEHLLPLAEDDATIDAFHQLLLHYEINVYGREAIIIGHAIEVLRRAADWPEVIDFDDMVWLPSILGVAFPPCDLLFIDECQDWSSAQHAMILPLSTSGRVCAVGDRFQAINIFRGADADSIPKLAAKLLATDRAMAEYPLTITFRCPRSHVALANEYVPDLTAAPNASEGEVREDVAFDVALAEVAPGDLVICPTNAPVVSACLKLIAQRRPAYVRGRAVGDQLITVLRGLPECRTVAQVSAGVESWHNRELNRLSDMDGVEDLIEAVGDRANGLQAILAGCQSPAEAEPLIGRLFSDDRREGVVTFSTIHRAKGDEAANVWFIDAPQRMPTKPWQARQNRNLRYVALTRSKHMLAFVEPPT